MSRRKQFNREGQGGTFSSMRFLLWVILGALGIPLIFLVVMHLPVVQDAVLKAVIQRIEGATPLRISVDGYWWWPPSRLSLHNVRIKASEKNLIECVQARITYRLTLNWPYVQPEEFNLEEPVIHLEKDSRGRWMVPGVAGTRRNGYKSMDFKQALEAMNLPGFQVAVVSGTILGQQDGQPVLTIRDVSGTLSLHVESSKDGPRLKVDLGDWQGRVWRLETGDWKLDMLFEVQKLRLGSTAGCRHPEDHRKMQHLILYT